MEITTFKLAKGLIVEDFIAANADIDIWLSRQPGFQSRRIAELDDGSIVDMLIWDSVANGTDAAERIMVEMGHSPVHAVIDQRSVVWRIAKVQRQTGPGSFDHLA
ncbi:hypothetical protein M0D69_27065 [Caballeronia sp. SEWSISQ10-4 2]|uniref:hypothetical protein n=1 Tax=Caballeronia sp. SEWSISQ10-4 2 TaxID=2937438 RepID=UPI00264CE4CD|nr:hypothetical protein [Caballeronia sp. SEWSISQ10-4 2]MDN7181599.1 hypothetical protein [Caballeronia sp. SEWSISQ10-4 2]